MAAVCVVVIMIAMGMVMAATVPMIMRVHRRVGAAFGFEWRIDQGQFGAKRRQQGFNRQIALRADTIR